MRQANFGNNPNPGEHIYLRWISHTPRETGTVLLTAYFDESGLGRSEKVCVIAGFMGNDAQWTALIADWIKGLKPRTKLHMKDLRFTGKKAHRTKDLLARLGPIPYRYNLNPIVGGVRHCDAEATFAANGMSDIFSAPYMLSMNIGIHVALRLLADSDEIMFVCERQVRYESAMNFM